LKRFAEHAHPFRQKCTSSLSLLMLIETFPVDERSIVAFLIVSPKEKTG